MRQFFVSDTHFGHSRIIEYCNRPFDDVHLMNLAMTTYWNATVGENDVVYHLGDFCFGNPDKYLAGLHGTITFVQGSHDKDLVKLQEAGGLGKHKLLHGYQEIHIDGHVIILSHYAMRSWPKSFHGSWHLFGHSHNRLQPYGKSFDVGVDGHNLRPWSWEEVIEKMDKLSNNLD